MSIEKRVISQAKWLYDITDDEKAKARLISDWGKEALRGYGIFSGGSEPEALHICRIDELDIYDSDISAARQASKDGIKIIPYREQPKQGDLKCYRFIDTEENRKVLFEKDALREW